jgi:hypothetical protein
MHLQVQSSYRRVCAWHVRNRLCEGKGFAGYPIICVEVMGDSEVEVEVAVDGVIGVDGLYIAAFECVLPSI